MGEPSLRQRLRAALHAAMKARDETAVSALRPALSAIDNAEAAHPSSAPSAQSGPIAGAVGGIGAGEVPRRDLSPSEVMAIVQADVDERLSAAEQYESLGRTEAAARLRAEAAVLARYL